MFDVVCVCAICWEIKHLAFYIDSLLLYSRLPNFIILRYTLEFEFQSSVRCISMIQRAFGFAFHFGQCDHAFITSCSIFYIDTPIKRCGPTRVAIFFGGSLFAKIRIKVLFRSFGIGMCCCVSFFLRKWIFTVHSCRCFYYAFFFSLWDSHCDGYAVYTVNVSYLSAIKCQDVGRTHTFP